VELAEALSVDDETEEAVLDALLLVDDVVELTAALEIESLAEADEDGEMDADDELSADDTEDDAGEVADDEAGAELEATLDEMMGVALVVVLLN